MNIICIVFGAVFIAFGIAFVFGKVHIHLSSWKKMSSEEKEKIKIVPLCRNIGEVIMLSGIIFLLKGLLDDFSNHLFTAAIIAWLIVAAFDLWHISRSSRYQNK